MVKKKTNSTFLQSIFITGIHPPSPHPKSPMWQRTDWFWVKKEGNHTTRIGPFAQL